MHHGVDEVTRARSLFHLTPSLPLEEIGKLTKVWQRCQVARNSINKKIKNKPNFLSCLFDGRRGRRISKLTMNNVFHPREQTRSLQTCGANGWAVRNCGTTVSPFSFLDWCVWLNMPYIISEHADEKKLQRTAIEPGKRRKLSCLVTFPLVPRWCYYPFNPGERKKRGCPGRRGRLCLYTASLID